MLLGILAKRAEKLIADNAPAILTAIGVTGTLTTAVMAARAAFESRGIIENEEMSRSVSTEPEYEPMTKIEKAELVWKLYIPAAISAGMTVAAIIAVNRIGARQVAAMASAYGLAEKALDQSVKRFEEYKKKTVEVIGEDREEEIRNRVVQEHYDKTPTIPTVFVGSGKFLCLDEQSGRFFRANREDIREAVNDLNEMIHGDDYASLSDFYHKVGLEEIADSDNVGWTTDRLARLEWGHGINKEGEPFFSYRFEVPPTPLFHRPSSAY